MTSNHIPFEAAFRSSLGNVPRGAPDQPGSSPPARRHKLHRTIEGNSTSKGTGGDHARLPTARHAARPFVSADAIATPDPNPIAPPAPPRAPGAGGARYYERKQAKILGEKELAKILRHIEKTSSAPESDCASLLATYDAGLRPCEVANLRASTLFDANGELLDQVIILPGTTKVRRQRVIPMHPRLHEALRRLFEVFPNAERIAYRRDAEGFIHYRSPASLTQWLCKTYREAGLIGCTGMSGRRSFATRIWNLGRKRGASIMDLEEMLGHSRLSSTPFYIEGKVDIADLVRSL